MCSIPLRGGPVRMRVWTSTKQFGIMMADAIFRKQRVNGRLDRGNRASSWGASR